MLQGKCVCVCTDGTVPMSLSGLLLAQGATCLNRTRWHRGLLNEGQRHRQPVTVLQLTTWPVVHQLKTASSSSSSSSPPHYHHPLSGPNRSLPLATSANMSPLFIVALLSLCLVLATHAQEETITMRGLVELKAPYAERDYSTDKIKGFYVDLLDELALIGKFNYTLIEAKNTTRNKTAGSQGSLDQRQLVNDIYSQRADFALSDKLYKGNHITARHLLFTDNYLVSGFSALVAKERLEDYGVSSLEELFAKNRVRATQDPEHKGIALGSVANSNTYTELSLSSDKNIGRRIYEWLYTKEERKFVDTREKGIQQVRDKPFALIELGLDNELAVDEDCDLTALPISFVYANGTKEGVVREYGIAVQKTSSRNLEILNKGIRELKVNGKLDELKRRYWNRKCNGAPYDKAHYVITSMCTLFSLCISLFLLS